MMFLFIKNFIISILFLSLAPVLSSCSRGSMRPINNLNNVLLETSLSKRDPSLSIRWLATIGSFNGKDKVELFDLRTRRKVSLPGLNRTDAQPISVSVNATGDKIALIRQIDGQTELLLYRRNLGFLERIEIVPKGVPMKVTLDARGLTLAVQVSRDGKWDIDVIRLPN